VVRKLLHIHGQLSYAVQSTKIKLRNNIEERSKIQQEDQLKRSLLKPHLLVHSVETPYQKVSSTAQLVLTTFLCVLLLENI